MPNSLARHISEQRIKAWRDAIDERHSSRSFDRKSIAGDILPNIESLLAGFSPLCSSARGYLVRRGASRLFTGLAGPFGKISSPPAAVVFAADIHLPGHMEAVGYLGEGVILEATALGLGTCWVTSSFSRERASDCVRLSPGWKVIGITPLGYESRKATLSDTVLKAIAKSDTRRSLDELVTGLPKNRWPKGLKDALEAARWAPSAANRQPWRFSIDSDGVTLSADREEVRLNSRKRLDCGIAMLHLEIACIASGLSGSWQFPEPGSHAIGRFHFR